VEIRATIPGARIAVDGKQVGVSPAQVPLEVGRHIVTVAKDGYSATPQVIDVSRRGTRKFDVPMSPVQVADKTPPPAPPVPMLVLTSDLASGRVSLDDSPAELEGQFTIPSLASQKHKLEISG